MTTVKLRLGDLRIEGESRAGTETWFRVFPPGLAFDCGRGALPLAGARDLFLTHGHLDHALGVPFVLSQRSLHHDQATRVFCPAPIAADLRDLIEAAARLEGVSYRYEIGALEAGERVEVGRGLSVEAFASDHVVASLGFHLLRRKKRLAKAFRGRSPEELIALREGGVVTTEEIEEGMLSYCGDSGPGIFETEPRLFESRVLLIECTFLDPGHRDRSARYKHLHLADLAERADRFQNETLVLHHLSRRHRVAELRQAVGEWLPSIADRVRLLIGPEEETP